MRCSLINQHIEHGKWMKRNCYRHLRGEQSTNVASRCTPDLGKDIMMTLVNVSSPGGGSWRVHSLIQVPATASSRKARQHTQSLIDLSFRFSSSSASRKHFVRPPLILFGSKRCLTAAHRSVAARWWHATSSLCPPGP